MIPRRGFVARCGKRAVKQKKARQNTFRGFFKKSAAKGFIVVPRLCQFMQNFVPFV
jgi:hypothetical protein